MSLFVLTHEKLVRNEIVKVRPRCDLVITAPAVSVELSVNAALVKRLHPLVKLEMLVPAVKIAAFFSRLYR